MLGRAVSLPDEATVARLFRRESNRATGLSAIASSWWCGRLSYIPNGCGGSRVSAGRAVIPTSEAYWAPITVATCPRVGLAEIPGLGVDSAQQIIAEVGATAATFPSSRHLAS
jgi:hypothetical protein